MIHLLLAVTLEAQTHFNAGLADLFAYAAPQAAAEFTAAEKADPTYDLAHWGEALARGTDLNTPLTSESFTAAHDAIAASLPIPYGTPDRDRLLIAATVARYAGNYENRDADEKAYRVAMEAVVAKYPLDDDVAMLLVEDLLETKGMHWNDDGTPLGDTSAEILKLIQTTLVRTPKHLFANHLCIHAYDSAPDRTPAIACAQVLDSMTFAEPMEHLAHMPAHTWVEIGDGKAGLASSERAWALNPSRYARHDAEIGYTSAMLCGNLEAAATWIQRIGALDGRQPKTSLPAALVSAAELERNGKIDAAAATLKAEGAKLDTAQEYLPPYPADVRLGALYYRAGRYSDALAAFQSVLKRRPRDPRGLFGASESYAKLGDPANAATEHAQFVRYWAGGVLTMNDF